MNVFAPEEVVHPGEPILHIVPKNSKLVVMARIDPIHADQYPGQPAMLRFSAFTARIIPKSEGQVVHVSADAMHDAETGRSWCEVEITIRAPEGTHGPGEPGGGTGSGDGGAEPHNRIDDLALAPRMPVEVHIHTEERSLISYLSKPVTDFFGRSLREE